jgi:hypothetical protein
VRVRTTIFGRNGARAGLVTTSCLAILLASVPVPASAQTSGGNTTVAAEDLGGVDQLRVPGDGLAQRVVARIPNGLRPLSIRADWQRTPEITAGALTVEQNGKSIATADVSTAPLVADGVTIPLRNPQIVDNTLTFDLRVRPSGDRAVCSPLLETGAITLSDLSLVFTGDDTPNTVAEFLPVAMQRLVISLPERPTSAQTQAAMEITTLAVRSFGLDQSRIEVVSSSANVRVGELERNVIIDGTAPAGITIDGRSARIGGDDKTVLQSATALATDARLLTQAPQVIVDKTTRTGLPNRERYSFADLNIPNVDLDGIGRVERTISMSQANVGGPAHNWNIRVVGTYEPQHEDNDGTFSIMTNGTMLRSVLLDESGALDVSVSIPDELAGRNPSLTFRFDTNPADASCAAANPFSASLSSKSSVDIERGNGATAAGFTRWPQVALPELHVAFDDASIDAIAGALNTVASLQATTTTPIRVAVADKLDESLASPLLAVITKTTVPDFLDAPLPGPGVRLIGDDGEELLTLNSNQELSSLQAYENGGKDVLVLAGPAPAAIRSLSEQLTDHENGWFSLRGDTWFRSGDHSPSAIQARGGALRVEPVSPATSTVLERHRALFIIAAVVIVVALLGLLYPRMVQDRPVSGAHASGAAGGRRADDRANGDEPAEP